MDARDRLILNYQAGAIEAALMVHGIRVAVFSIAVGPRLVTFHFRLLAPARVAAILRLAPDVALAIGANECRLRRLGSGFVAEVVNPQAAVVPLPGLVRRVQLAGQVRTGAAILGISAEDGSIVQLQLTSPDVVHALVAGTTGSGKTGLVRSMLASLVALNAPDELRVAIVDRKGDFGPFSDIPHIIDTVAGTAETWTPLIVRIVAEMDRRYERGYREPRIVLAVDELADVLGHGADPVLQPALSRLAALGRDAGIHLLLATQKPSSEAVSTLLTSNLPGRLVGRVVKPEDARLAAGVGGTGAERLGGRGDFIAVVGGRQVRFQAAWLDTADLPALISAGSGTVAATVTLPEDGESLRDRIRQTLRLITNTDDSTGRPPTPVPVEAVQLARNMAEASGGRWPSAWSLRQTWADMRYDKRGPGLPRNLRADKAQQAIAEAQAIEAEQNRTVTPPSIAAVR